LSEKKNRSSDTYFGYMTHNFIKQGGCCYFERKDKSERERERERHSCGEKEASGFIFFIIICVTIFLAQKFIKSDARLDTSIPTRGRWGGFMGESELREVNYQSRSGDDE